jgi:hypothetical protein
VPSLLVSAVDHLFDDAGLFPPARLPMAEALAAHGRAKAGVHGRYVGPFLCPDTRLDELEACVASGRPRPAELGVIAYGPGNASRRLSPNLPGLAQCEAPLGTPLPDLGGRVRRYLEIPRQTPVAQALDAVAAAGARAKIRCGGATRDDTPPCARLADVLVGCVERGLTLKATAGLHQPFRHQTRLGPQHGFLNLLAAAAEARRGGDRATVAAILAAEESEAAAFVDRLARARELLMSIGTCSIDEPMEALTERGLL